MERSGSKKAGAAGTGQDRKKKQKIRDVGGENAQEWKAAQHIITVDKYNHELRGIPIQTRRRGNQSSRRKFAYKDVICTFDIETSRITPLDCPDIADEQSILYMWAFYLHKHVTVIGRDWHDLQRLFSMLSDDLQENEKICVFVHNLSYEWQFLRTIYEFSEEEVFCTAPRRILKCSMLGKFDFRCSYLLSNLSLDAYTKQMHATHRKLSGEEFGYNVKRFPWTPLTKKQWKYQWHDVWGLAEALENDMESTGDNLYTLPLTSTGYVRRDVKREMRKIPHDKIERLFPPLDLYVLAKEAFRGGNTHANRLYAGRILHDVKSADRSSSYPDVQCNHLFPCTKFRRRPDMTMTEFLKILRDGKLAAIFRVRMRNVRLRNKYWGFPYLSESKCRHLLYETYTDEDGKTVKATYTADNGRVLSADYLETSLTDVDLRIVLEEYDVDDIDVFDVWTSIYRPLPEPLTGCTKKYYRAKTELKNVDGMELIYNHNKARLNGIYGMSAQDIGKQNITFNPEAVIDPFTVDTEPLEEILADAKKKSFQSYLWGVWVTAWARWELEQGLKLAGDGAIYCDTDSVKYIGDIDWTEYNNRCIAASTANGAFADDPHGVRHYMGVFEQERSYYRFATLGAKKYAYQYEPGGETKVTISGVGKKKGGAELDKGDRYGKGLERFCDTDHPFIFRDAGGTECRYNDNPENKTVIIDGHKLLIGPNVVIRDSTYTLGATAEYLRLLEYTQGIDNLTD